MIRPFRPRAVVAVVSLLVTLAWSTATRAAGPSASEAERMFELGRQAATQGQYDTACNLFRESYRIDPAVGTLINLGDCEEHLGHPGDALRYYEQAFARLSVTDDRLPLVRERIDVIEKESTRLEVRLGQGAPASTKISIDGRVLEPSALETPILLTPGNHIVVASAVGYRGSRQGLSLKSGEARKLQVWPGPPLEEASPTFLGTAPAEADERREARARTWRTVGWGVAGVGVASLWVGSVTGLFAIDRESQRADNCDANNVCNQIGYDAARSGRTFATVSTITVIGGAAAVLGGVYLVISNHPGAGSARTAIAPSPGGAGLSLVRSF